MKSTPRCISWDDDVERIVARRSAEEHMTRSAYVRKCIRDESERHREPKRLSTLPEETKGQLTAPPTTETLKGMYLRGSRWWFRHTPARGKKQVRESLGPCNKQEATVKAIQILASRKL